VHQAFGFKFWAFVVGAAPLPPDLEEFWRRMGFAVVQGYGLTETAPIVTLNHPFKTSKGSVGTPIAGVDIRIAEDGEILVRGENVTSGYYGDADARWPTTAGCTPATSAIATRKAALFIKGRKKEMIVTPDGLNVFPEDVERVLDALPGVRESAVVGVTEGRAGASARRAASRSRHPTPDAVVRAANSALEAHQRVRTASVWTDGDLPRTDGTRKLKRAAIASGCDRDSGRWPRAARKPSRRSSSASAADGRVSSTTTLDELGLSSLERVELMVALEDRFQSRVDESRFAQAGERGGSEVAARRRRLRPPRPGTNRWTSRRGTARIRCGSSGVCRRPPGSCRSRACSRTSRWTGASISARFAAR
jgi:long-chain acyl-CoA synthetase